MAIFLKMAPLFSCEPTVAKLASSSETAFFANFEALNFVNVESAKMHKNQNSEPLNVLKWQILHF